MLTSPNGFISQVISLVVLQYLLQSQRTKIDPIEQNRARLRLHKSKQRRGHSRLSGARTTHNTDVLSRGDGAGKAVKRRRQRRSIAQPKGGNSMLAGFISSIIISLVLVVVCATIPTCSPGAMVQENPSRAGGREGR